MFRERWSNIRVKVASLTLESLRLLLLSIVNVVVIFQVYDVSHFIIFFLEIWRIWMILLIFIWLKTMFELSAANRKMILELFQIQTFHLDFSLDLLLWLCLDFNLELWQSYLSSLIDIFLSHKMAQIAAQLTFLINCGMILWSQLEEIFATELEFRLWSSRHLDMTLDYFFWRKSRFHIVLLLIKSSLLFSLT